MLAASYLPLLGSGKPSSVHAICGVGLPAALHFRDTAGPGCRVCSIKLYSSTGGASATEGPGSVALLYLQQKDQDQMPHYICNRSTRVSCPTISATEGPGLVAPLYLQQKDQVQLPHYICNRRTRVSCPTISATEGPGSTVHWLTHLSCRRTFSCNSLNNVPTTNTRRG
jgi:hypothetical protein